MNHPTGGKKPNRLVRAKPARSSAAVGKNSSTLTRLLIVDDDTDAVEALSDLLAYRGYDVTTACNGVEALQRLAELPLPHVLVLDLSMPFMNGWELIGELSKSRELAEIPVIVVSALAHTQDVPARAIIAKPLDVEVLLNIIGTLGEPPPGQ
jgi:CheY-like chemotaxis protein